VEDPVLCFAPIKSGIVAGWEDCMYVVKDNEVTIDIQQVVTCTDKAVLLVFATIFSGVGVGGVFLTMTIYFSHSMILVWTIGIAFPIIFSVLFIMGAVRSILTAFRGEFSTGFDFKRGLFQRREWRYREGYVCIETPLRSIISVNPVDTDDEDSVNGEPSARESYALELIFDDGKKHRTVGAFARREAAEAIAARIRAHTR
jgi:hypothetical protein